MMGPLEALVREEEEAIARPTDSTVTEDLARFLPHVRHVPFYDLINSLGSLHQIQDLELPKGLEVTARRIARRKEKLVMEAVGEIERKYGIAITQDDIKSYLVGFARRILDYAKQRLPGVILEDHETIVDLAVPDGIKDADDILRIAEMIVKPDIQITNSVRNIGYFYAHNQRTGH